MGASNVATAFALYAGKVPPLSMQILAYMALVAKDTDPRPWFGKGHAALADAAMGRPLPITEADERAVRRAVQPLIRIGAVEVDRRPSPRSTGRYRTVRYRLNLTGRLPTVDKRVDKHVDNRPAIDVHQPTLEFT